MSTHDAHVASVGRGDPDAPLEWRGAYTIVMAQMGSRLDMDARTRSPTTRSQPFWFVIDDGPRGLPVGHRGCRGLLLRSRLAAWLFALSLCSRSSLNNAYDVAAKTSLALADQGWRNLTIVVVAIAMLQFAYAWSMKTRGVLN